MPLPIAVALIGYVAAGFATPWLGYGWFVAFVLLSPAVATILAVREYEYWPVVHPVYSLFIVYPAILLGLQLYKTLPIEWGQWLAWSFVLVVALTGLLTICLRRHIDREWAVGATFVVLLAFVGFALDEANANMGSQASQLHRASIESTSPGGRRQGGPRISVELERGDRRIFFVAREDYARWRDGRSVCVCEFDGALGWRWSILSDCPANTLSESAAVLTR